ncbi:MAG: response regulator [Gammaproteobacteria bacterium]|nr:response regulator [Gammaproteobacteria bacterium]
MASETLLPRIAIVDDQHSVTSLLSTLLEHEGYDAVTFNNGKDFLEYLKSTRVDMVLLDLMMPRMTGYDVIKQVRTMITDEYIPILIISALTDRDSRLKALSLGIDDFLSKPIDREELWLRVKNTLKVKAYQDQLIQEKMMLECTVEQDEQDIELSHIETIRTLIIASEFRDDETGQHVGRIGHYARTLAKLSGASREYFDTLFYASALHDIGKLAISDAILQKSGPLTNDEFERMKQHTVIGNQILSNASNISPYLRLGAEVALTHHERWNGTGYPYGLSGTNIPLGGRIVAICDVYDALRSARPYKPAFDHEKTLSILRHGDGRTEPEHFDPELLRLFLSNEQLFATIYKDDVSIFDLS